MNGKPARLYEDNTACIQLGSALKTRSSARHYVLQLYWLQQRVAQLKEVELVRCPSSEMLADIFTKALPHPQFIKLRNAIMGIKETATATATTTPTTTQNTTTT